MFQSVMGDLSSYFPAVLVAFGTSSCILWGVLLATQYKPGGSRQEPMRQQVKEGLSRYGGVALIGALWCGLAAWSGFEFSPTLQALFFGSIAILIFGTIDDMRPISWPWQLCFQLGLGGLLLWLGMRIEIMQGIFGGTIDFRNWPIPFTPSLMLMAWLVLVMNAVNWLDGLDGLLGSVSLMGFGTLTLLRLFPEVNQPALAVP